MHWRVHHWLIILALLLIASPLSAQSQEQLQIMSARQHSPEQLELIVACSDAAQPHEFMLSLDSGRPSPMLSIEPYTLPLSIGLIIDSSQAMQASGTPHSTSFADLRLLIESMLIHLPVDTQLSMVRFANEAQMLSPLSTNHLAVREQLQLAAPQDTAALSDTLGLALEQGIAQLQYAPAGPRALIVYAASAPISAAQIAKLKPQLSDTKLLIIGHNSASEEALISIASELGGSYLAYHSGELARLPALLQATQGAYAGIIEQRRHLRILAATNAPESGLRLQGCGGQASAVIQPMELSQVNLFSKEVSLAFGGGMVVAGASLALIGQMRKRLGKANRHHGSRRSSNRETTGSFQRGIDQPTERKAKPAGSPEQIGYKLAIWDGNQRSSYLLTQRQCVLGRNAGCDLHIDNRWVSTLHARLSIVGNSIEITDLGSSNGTFIGAHRQALLAQHPERLSIGDELWLGPEVQIVIHQLEQNG